MEYTIATYTYTTPLEGVYFHMLRLEVNDPQWYYNNLIQTVVENLRSIGVEIIQSSQSRVKLDLHSNFNPRLVLHFENQKDFFLAKLRV
jgi:hypothetical protein